MEGDFGVNDLVSIYPSFDMNFWRINNKDTSVTIKWSRNLFDDYKILAYQFYECGYKTFEKVIDSGHDNPKSDMWFLASVFLVRHGIELGLKALLCRVLSRKKDVQDAFEECCHDVSMLLKKYSDSGVENFLTDKEEKWLTKYLGSMEEVDKNSDVFRFPFEDDFLSKYGDRFLDNKVVANNLLHAFELVKKCIEKGIIFKKEEFDITLEAEFFVFKSDGFGNCHLWQEVSDGGFPVKIRGYSEAIDFIYSNRNIANKDKLYPLIFMFRNTIELYLKRLFCSRVDNGVSLKVFHAKRKSHYIKKDLWKYVKPVIESYTNDSEIIDIVERLLDEINGLDKKGDNFRYPTSYSLEYRFNDKKLDLSNVYTYLKAIINFFESCVSSLDLIADYENEMKTAYEYEMINAEAIEY